MAVTPTHEIDTPVEVGSRAPDFELRDESGRSVSIKDYRGQTLVLAFCPDDWDPALPVELTYINDVFRRLPDHIEAVGVSREGVMVDLDLGNRGSLRIPVLRDFSLNGEASRRFGVSGSRALFVIDGEGIVRWKQVGLIAGPSSVDDIVRSLDVSRDAGKGLDMSRREFLVTATAVAFALTFLPRLGQAESGKSDSPKQTQTDSQKMSLNVNGQDVRMDVEPRVTLLDALRERAGLTGTKKGCDHGQCGACTVLVDGRRVNSCLMLAVMQQGKKITTIEGLGSGEDLHPVQAAFIKHDGFQCGYCTPGQILSAVACIHEGHANNDEDIKTWMSGNICRCGAYVGIREAIKEAKSATLKEATR